MEKALQENAKQALQLELDRKTRTPRVCSHKLLPRLLLDSGRSGGDNPIPETTLGRAVEELENGLCRRNVDLTKETGKCLEEIEKTGKVHRIKPQQTFVKALPPESLEKLARSLSLMCLDMTFLEDW